MRTLPAVAAIALVLGAVLAATPASAADLRPMSPASAPASTIAPAMPASAPAMPAAAPAVAPAEPSPPPDPLVLGRDCTEPIVCFYASTGTPLGRFLRRTSYFVEVDRPTRLAVFVRNNRVSEAVYFRHASGRVSCAEPGRTAQLPAGDPLLGVLIGPGPRCTFPFG